MHWQPNLLEKTSNNLSRIKHQLEQEIACVQRAADQQRTHDIQARPSIRSDKEILAVVRRIIKARRLRDHVLGVELFADPAWDILLDMYAAHLAGATTSVSSSCVAASVPQTTALRWINKLEELDLLVSRFADDDRRCRLLEIAPTAAREMERLICKFIDSGGAIGV